MSVSVQIQRLQQAKADLKAKLIEKGVEVSDSLLISDYPALLDNIKTGSSDYAVVTGNTLVVSSGSVTENKLILDSGIVDGNTLAVGFKTTPYKQ